jgi:hypothetical protein
LRLGFNVRRSSNLPDNALVQAFNLLDRDIVGFGDPLQWNGRFPAPDRLGQLPNGIIQEPSG